VEAANRALFKKMKTIDKQPLPEHLRPPKQHHIFQGSLRKKAQDRAVQDHENKDLLKRLQDVNPIYDSAKWDKERKRTEKEI
jgi:hypothetical protein